MKKTLPQNAILIADNAKKVFKGIMFDVYQWEQTLFDGTHKTFEMLKRPDTVEFIVIQDDGTLLFTDEKQPGRAGRLRIPGGRNDEGEDWLTTAKRECKEELGLTLNNWRLIFVSQPASKIEWFYVIYIAQDIVAQEPATGDAGEKITVAPKTFEQAKALIFSANDPVVTYLRPVFERVNSLEELKVLPEFKGQEVDR